MEDNKNEPMSKMQTILLVFVAIFMFGMLAFLCCRFYGLHLEYAWINGMFYLCSSGLWLCSGFINLKKAKVFSIFSLINAVLYAITTVLAFYHNV